MMAHCCGMRCVFYGSLQSIHLYIFAVARWRGGAAGAAGTAGTDGMDGMDGMDGTAGTDGAVSRGKAGLRIADCGLRVACCVL